MDSVRLIRFVPVKAARPPNWQLIKEAFMSRRLVFGLLCGLLVSVSVSAQSATGTLQVVAMLVDSELNVRPVPRHALVIKPNAGGEQPRVVTGLDGKAQTALSPGEYVIESERPLEFQGKTYRWSQRVTINPNTSQTVELGNDNAAIETINAPPRSGSDLPALFQQWQGSVVTVWSDTGHGSGFVIDKRGLIATNQHVVGVSDYAAVQFSASLKVPARIVATSPEKDVAILRVNPKYLADVESVNLGYTVDGKAPAVEGEQVFTIGSPLHQSKIMTSGIVSKMEPAAIISDVNINHGNSGGPLFTTRGVVIGITTFGDLSDQGGPGISGIVRIDEARESIEKAVVTLHDEPPAEGTVPVEPMKAYPMEALKQAITAKTVKAADYTFEAGDFDVAVITPILNYGLDYQIQQGALKERAKRNKDAKSIQTTPDVFSQYKNWAEYVGEFQPVVIIDASPKLVEGFWSAVGRLARLPAQLHFKSDFYRMRLMCADKEIVPIHPAKIEHRVVVTNSDVNVNDASYEGFYMFTPDSIGPHCGNVKLTLFTEKDPQKGETKVLPAKLVQRIWDDFAPYRQATNP